MATAIFKCKIVPTSEFSAEHWAKTLVFAAQLDHYQKVLLERFNFGWLGVPSRNADCYPFVLYPDATMDFGASFETDDERFGELNLSTGSVISISDHIEISIFDGIIPYCVEKITTVE